MVVNLGWTCIPSSIFQVDHDTVTRISSGIVVPVDFAIGLVIKNLNLPDGQVLFFGEIQITEVL